MTSRRLLSMGAVAGMAVALTACPDRQDRIDPATDPTMSPPTPTPPPATIPPATTPIPPANDTLVNDTLIAPPPTTTQPGGPEAPATPGAPGQP
jgi:hypothetical protein